MHVFCASRVIFYSYFGSFTNLITCFLPSQHSHACFIMLILETVAVTSLIIATVVVGRQMGWRSFYSLGPDLDFHRALVAYQTLVAAVTWSWALNLTLAYLCVVKLVFDDYEELASYIFALGISITMIAIDKCMLMVML